MNHLPPWMKAAATALALSGAGPAVAGTAPPPRTLQPHDPRLALADSLAAHLRPDTIYTLAPIVVRARRLEPAQVLAQLPGQGSYVDIEPLRQRLATTAEVLECLPGLHVSNYGGLGAFSTVSIRGCGASQVSVYLDGMPLARAGLGVMNLSELPFTGLDHIEVYRGFAPPDLPGAGIGGAINLVSLPAVPAAGSDVAPPAAGRGGQGSAGGAGAGTVLAGTGSFDTRRIGAFGRLHLAGNDALLVANLLQSRGDFPFLDDNGTPLNPSDDEVVPRRNDWARSIEVLAKLDRPLARTGSLQLANQWFDRQQGVAGIPSIQATQARLGATYDLTSMRIGLPPLWGDRLRFDAHLYHQWRRDTFADPKSEIGLGYQDNQDVTRTIGSHLTARAWLPRLQQTAVDLELRGETFMPWRRFPQPQRGPEQGRTTMELALEQRLQLFDGRFDLHAGWRAARERDRFPGSLRTPYSQQPATAGTRHYREPRLGARLRLAPGLHAKGTYGQYHRTPGFLELFGDGGSVAGSSDLVAESGINRDFGLEAAGELHRIRARLDVAHFENQVEHLIILLPQSQHTFVARNIGSARLRGEEWSGKLAAAGRAPRWSVDLSYTHLRSTDLGVDRTWFAGKTLPGRPEHELSARLGVRLSALELGYEYEHLGRNYLDRWNSAVVGRRDLHGFDARATWSGVAVEIGARNLTGERAADVAGFPLPGRTLSASTTCRF